MEWLNYHHLFYFWTVVNEGSVTAASRKLRLAPSMISAQMQELEEALDEPLFFRVGRRSSKARRQHRASRATDADLATTLASGYNPRPVSGCDRRELHDGSCQNY